MAFKSVDGSTFFFCAAALGAAKVVTAISNASPAVASSVGHSLVDNDLVLYTGNWEQATGGLFLADQLTADTVALKGLDARETIAYPAGAGAGTLQKVDTTSWTQVPGWESINTQQGSPRTATDSPIAAVQDKTVVLGMGAGTIELSIAWDPTDATYQLMLAMTAARKKVPMKMLDTDGVASYGYGTMMTSRTPTRSKGSKDLVSVYISFLGPLMAYGPTA
ncbi:MAG: hypothetical protein RIQ53_4171 [Pseudomonadota bacterium]|jgi:hypothetical protein